MAYVDYGQGIMQAASSIADALKAVNAMKFDLLVQKARMDFERQQKQEQRAYETEMLEREWRPDSGYRAMQAAQESKLRREELQEKARLEKEQQAREFGYQQKLREMPIKYEYPERNILPSNDKDKQIDNLTASIKDLQTEYYKYIDSETGQPLSDDPRIKEYLTYLDNLIRDKINQRELLLTGKEVQLPPKPVSSELIGPMPAAGFKLPWKWNK